MKIGKIRKDLQDPKKVKALLDIEYEKSKDLKDFLTFECSDFFKGYDLAEKNRKIYNYKIVKTDKRIDFLQSFLSHEIDYSAEIPRNSGGISIGAMIFLIIIIWYITIMISL